VIIDAHVHITKNGKWFNTDYDASVERLIKSLEESKIDKAVVLPIAPLISNDFVAKVCDDYPDKLIGFASVNPRDSDAVKKLEEDVIKYNLKGLKLHPRLQNFKPNNPVHFPIYKKAEELGIPILFDTFLNKPTLLKDQIPLLYDEIARIIPDTPIIMAHFGGFKFLEALAVANANKNIYFDISGTLEYFYNTPYQDQIKFVLEKIGFNRVIYGSDYPEKDVQETLIVTKEVFKCFNISKENSYKIFSKNIIKILNSGGKR
jgi:predicted TIM-barrel fold metal-dependent hydrolase